MNNTIAVLFDEGEIVGYKQQADKLTIYHPDESTCFFHLNPLSQHIYGSGGGAKSNIAVYRNILIEWDGLTLKKQANLAARAGIPYSLATYSGNKSNHYIISLSEPFSTEAEYTYYARLIMEALGSDTSMSNVNRVSRLPGAKRPDTGKHQTPLAPKLDRRISREELTNWLFLHPYMRDRVQAVLKRWAHIEQEQQAAKLASEAAGLESKTILPRIYQLMLTEGALHPLTNSRHESLVKFAAWLKSNWHEPAAIPELLFRASEAMGIPGERRDVEGIIKHFGLEG